MGFAACLVGKALRGWFRLVGVMAGGLGCVFAFGWRSTFRFGGWLGLVEISLLVSGSRLVSPLAGGAS